MFKYFDSLKNTGYKFKDLKNFCDKFSTIINIQMHKRMVKEAYNAYLKALKNYESIIDYGISLMDDVEANKEIIDEKGKKYFRKSMKKEFCSGYLDQSLLIKIQENDIKKNITEKIKKISEIE